MTYKIGLEIIEPDNWVAFVFDFPGCFSQAKIQIECIDNIPNAITEYLNWCEGYETAESEHEIQFEITEKFTELKYQDDYTINAFFEHDKKPLTQDDIYRIEWILNLTRKDLMNVIQTAKPEQLKQTIERERQTNIIGILKHIATAELWYWESLALAFPRDELPRDIIASLHKTRTHTLLNLEKLINNDNINERRGEKWSARKIIRRLLWHERIHTRQIERYLSHG